MADMYSFGLIVWEMTRRCVTGGTHKQTHAHSHTPEEERQPLLGASAALTLIQVLFPVQVSWRTTSCRTTTRCPLTPPMRTCWRWCVLRACGRRCLTAGTATRWGSDYFLSGLSLSRLSRMFVLFQPDGKVRAFDSKQQPIPGLLPIWPNHQRIPPLTCRRSLSAILVSELWSVKLRLRWINMLAMWSDRKCPRAGGRVLGVTMMVSERLCSRDFLFVL